MRLDLQTACAQSEKNYQLTLRLEARCGELAQLERNNRQELTDALEKLEAMRLDRDLADQATTAAKYALTDARHDIARLNEEWGKARQELAARDTAIAQLQEAYDRLETDHDATKELYTRREATINALIKQRDDAYNDFESDTHDALRADLDRMTLDLQIETQRREDVAAELDTARRELWQEVLSEREAHAATSHDLNNAHAALESMKQDADALRADLAKQTDLAFKIIDERDEARTANQTLILQLAHVCERLDLHQTNSETIRTAMVEKYEAIRQVITLAWLDRRLIKPEELRDALLD